MSDSKLPAVPAVGQTYKVFEAREKGKLVAGERKIPALRSNEVLVKVLACGLCHSDYMSVHGTFPGHKFPSIPGHEIVGTVVSVGSGVTVFKAGDYVGRGWHGSHCHQCRDCRAGDPGNCPSHTVTGIHNEGGYAEYMVAPHESLVRVPSTLSPEDAASFLCAGLTVYNALRHTDAKPGQVVAVQAIGGLGHYGVQFARSMGFHTVAISSGGDKEKLAKELGAHAYIDTSKQDPVAELQKLGGAKVILTTAYDSKAMSKVFGGPGARGSLVVVGADIKPLEISPMNLIPGSKSIMGWASGVPADAEDTLNFAVQAGVRSYVEVYPFEQTQAAYERMLSGKARFRVVISHTGAHTKHEAGKPFARSSAAH